MRGRKRRIGLRKTARLRILREKQKFEISVELRLSDKNKIILQRLNFFTVNLMTTEKLQLVYTLLCDDVRLEMGNKISLMGVFQNIMVEKLPVSLIKFAVINHWRGEGQHQAEVRILSPDKENLIVTSQPTHLELTNGGFTDNVSFFVNVVFPEAGTYWVQTLANSVLLEELPLIVADAIAVTETPTEEFSETVN